MDLYSLYAIVTGLMLLVLVGIIRAIAYMYPKVKYISISSIISFALVLTVILFRCCDPYEGWLDSLYMILWMSILYLPFAIATIIGSLFNMHSYGIIHDPVWHCIAFVIAFMLYTLLISIVIRIALSLKKRFWSGDASTNRK